MNVLLCFLVFGMLFSSSPANAGEVNSLNAYYETFPNLILVYPTLDLSTASQTEVLMDVESYAKFLRQWGKVTVIKDADFSMSQSPEDGVFIIGTEHSNAVLKKYKNELSAKCNGKVFSFFGRKWFCEDIGAIFLSSLENRLAIALYLPDLRFLRRFSDVFHGSTEFLIFNSVCFSGDPQVFIAKGNFKKTGKSWNIDENSLKEMDPIDEMVVVALPAKGSLLRKGDILKTLDGNVLKRSTFFYIVGRLNEKNVYEMSILRAGKTISLKIAPKEINDSKMAFFPMKIPQFLESKLVAEFARLKGIFQECYIDSFDRLVFNSFPVVFPKAPSTTGNSKVSLLDFYKSLARFASAFHDGHTYINTDQLRAFLQADVLLRAGRLFPFQPVIGGTKLFVPENSFHISKGSEILKINGRPTVDVLAKLAEYSSGDTLSHQCSEFAFKGFSDFYCLAFGEEAVFVLELKTGEKLVSVTIPAVGLFDREVLSHQSDRDPVSEIASGLLLLRIDSFSTGKEFSTLVDTAFKKLMDKEIANLAIDLRRNGGGSTEALCELFSHLVSSDYQIYKMCRVVRSKLGEKEGLVFEESTPYGKKTIYQITSRDSGGKDVFSGRVFVLIGPQTFSTAFDCAVMLKELRGAVLVGEAAGGRMVQSGSHLQVPVLSHGMTISVPYKDFLPNLKSLKDFASTPFELVVEADYEVSETEKSIQSGLDPCVEFLKDFLRREKQFRSLHQNKGKD